MGQDDVFRYAAEPANEGLFTAPVEAFQRLKGPCEGFLQDVVDFEASSECRTQAEVDDAGQARPMALEKLPEGLSVPLLGLLDEMYRWVLPVHADLHLTPVSARDARKLWAGCEIPTADTFGARTGLDFILSREANCGPSLNLELPVQKRGVLLGPVDIRLSR